MNNLLELMPNWVIYLYIFLFGICIGSFLNVAILRGLSGEDIIFDRSHCPKCKNQLKWYMNIPLLSYICLRGKCAYCKTNISFQYPLVEFLNGIAYVYAFMNFGFNLKAVFSCVVISLFILLAATDFIETVILDYHAYILTFFGILAAALKISEISLLESILTAITGFVVFEVISRSGYLFVKQRMFGEGDSLIILALGAFFGYKSLIIILALSMLLQAFMAVPTLSLNSFKKGKKQLGISYILTLFIIVLILSVNIFSLIENSLYYLLFVFVVVGILLYVLKNIIFEINERKKELEKIIENDENYDEFESSTFSLMPFGPALIFAGTICLFWQDKIVMLIKNFLY